MSVWSPGVNSNVWWTRPSAQTSSWGCLTAVHGLTPFLCDRNAHSSTGTAKQRERLLHQISRLSTNIHQRRVLTFVLVPL